MNISKDLIIILVIALVIFGPSRIAGLGGALGKTIRDFRKSMGDQEEDRPVPPKPTDTVTH
jgi:sec-independent protein translocase protein TatA